MSRPTLALLAVATIAVGCYKDDVRALGGPASRMPMAKVLLTDDPFPFDSVQSVQVYVVSIALSTHPDTGTSADSMHWVTVAAKGSETLLHLCETKPLEKGNTGIGFLAKDVIAEAKALEAKGVRFTKPAHKESWGAFAMFADPDGNEFWINEA